MAYSITQLYSDIEGVLHGTTTNQITDINGLIYRAARKLLLDVDPMETKRIQAFANPIFNSVYDYALPADLKGNKIIDIRPQVNRFKSDILPQKYNQAFDLSKLTDTTGSFTINYDSASKTIRINDPNLSAPVQVNTAESITGNGTWAASSSASSLAVDNVYYATGTGSLKFDLAITGPTGILTNSTQNAVDLTDHYNQSTLFLYTYLPTASAFTNINLKWGSSASAYYSVNATTQFDGTAFQNGWNLLSFAWNGASVTGSPDYTAIDYLAVNWTYSGAAQTSVRLDAITSILGSILEIEYYSKYLFRDASTGAFAETIASSSDLINLDTDSYNLLTWAVAMFAVQQQQGVDASFYDGPYFERMYNQALQRYQALYKSELQKPQSTYYQLPRPRQGLVNRVRRGF